MTLLTRPTATLVTALLLSAAAIPGAQSRRPAPAPAPTSATPALTEDDLFDQTTVQDIALTVNSRDWNDLREKYTENTYYLADLRWRGQTVRNIGMRSRGNTSRSATKPGLRLDFDRYASSQQFLGFKSLVLDNMVQDPAMLRERVAVKFFREMGLPAPRVVHARLTVNNQFLGLYTIVEPIDKKFLKRALGENDGYLYEFKGTGSHYDFGYRGDELEHYAGLFEPKTRESASMVDLYRPIREMTFAISESPSHRFLESVGEFMDLQKFLTYVAVEAFLAERDGVLGEWGMNNFYLYRFEKSVRFELLPWDRDTALFDVEMSIYNRAERNVLMKRLMEYPEMRTHFEDALRRSAELAMRQEAAPSPAPEPSPEDDGERQPGPGWLEREIRAAYGQIRALAHQDPSAPFSPEEFEAEIEKLLSFAKERPGAVLQDLVRSASATDR